MEYFCVAIGRRLAGSPEEQRAADYTARRFHELGLSNVACLPFSCRAWQPGRSELLVLDEPAHAIPCEAITHSAATGDEGVEGELAVFEPMDYDYGRGLHRTDLAGKIGLFYGSYTESAEVFKSLQDSDLRALLFVDTRLPMAWPNAEGMGERYMPLVRKPMANVALMDAWRMVREGVKRVRLTSTGRVVDGPSHNVVGELPGSDPAGKVIVLCAHIDSVALGVGADDNAGGMAAILECARRLRERPLKHTVRFIGFGAEEQLSVGAGRYVKEQAPDLDRVAFVCNLDSIAAILGITEVVSVGTPELDEYVRLVVEERRQFGRVKAEVSPYQDQFPFAARGIPGLWFTRKTHEDMYWYHHSPSNDLGVCSMEQIAWTAEIVCEILAELVTAESWPFPLELAPAIKAGVERYVREMFD